MKNNSLNVSHKTLTAPALTILDGMELRLVRIATSGQLPNNKTRKIKYVNYVNTRIWICKNNFSFFRWENNKKWDRL